MTSNEVVQKLWNLCNVLRDDGITYHEYVTELTYILFLKMSSELENEEKIENFLFKNKNIALIFSFLILILNSLILIKNKGIYLIVAITGIIFSILLEKTYSNKNMKFLNHLNYKSYSIYLLSWFPQVFVRIVFFQILKLNWIIVLPISTFLGIYFPCSIVWLVNSLNKKNKKFKFLNKIIGI